LGIEIDPRIPQASSEDSRRYLVALVLGLGLWCGLFFGFTFLVDPFGVSPLRVQISRLNAFKPRRVDIDRFIKPYEVWRYQPKTVFLGTSRIHQAFDPAALDGTRFAPAYNASIPASSLGLNISHLQQYLDFDQKLRTVTVELFLYNFTGQGQEHPPKDFYEYLRNTVNLFISGDTLWAAVQTVGYNLAKSRPAYEIKPGGHYYYPPGHNAKGPYDGFAAGIWKLHESRTDGMKLHEPAMDAVKTIIELCRQRGLELIFVLSPNHAYDDYYIDAVGSWPAVQEWLTRLSALDATIYSFSQPNSWTYEPVSERMRYWNDPYHFSLDMGSAMLKALAGEKVDGMPPDFVQRLTPGMVAAHVASRQAAVRDWAKNNATFVAAFHEEKKRWEARKTSRGDPVEESLAAIDAVLKALAQVHPGQSVTAYREVSSELVTAGKLPPNLVNAGRIENPWGGRIVAQIFPAGAWKPGAPATYNVFSESVPAKECVRLIEALSKSGPGKVFRMNVEPSGRIYDQFPVTRPDSCSEGVNTVSYTVVAK
jgi:hypothetical protein